MLRYYITDRKGCPDLLACIRRAVLAGVEYVQIREKDLSARELLALTEAAVSISASTKILVNGRCDVALAAGAHGVHLPADAVPPTKWRQIVPPSFLIGMSCHSIAETHAAEGADFIVFGPIFQTPDKGPPKGLQALEAVTRDTNMPVFALGGVSWSNAKLCLEAGAAGIAGIRLFQGSELP